MSKIFSRIALLLTILIACNAIPVLQAHWFYNNAPESNENYLSIQYFPWVGSDILPDEGEAHETTQLNGLHIIIMALNNEGLSGTSKLNQYINKRVQNFSKLEYGSVDVKQDVASLLSDVATFNPNFEFILQGNVIGSGKNKYVEYYTLYMIDKPAFDAATNAWKDSGLSTSTYEKNPEIFDVYFENVNRVLITKDAYGRWHAELAEAGFTGFGYYEGSNNGGGQKVWTFDPGSWQSY